MTAQTHNREVTHRTELVGDGVLDIYTVSVGGQVILEAFPLASLASVLNITETTLEGRYTRTGLRMLAVSIPGKGGRPLRGFELRRFDEVTSVLTNPKSRIAIDANAGTYLPPEMTTHLPLVWTAHGGKNYITPQAIADHFGLSLSTVRNRLHDSGLARRAETLPPGANGGRPRRVYPEAMMADIKLAVVDGDKFRNVFDRALIPAGSKAKAQDYVEANSVYQPPVAFDRSAGHLAPVVPIGGRALNGVNTPRVAGGFNTKAMADELVAELETIFSTARPIDMTPLPVRATADDGEQPMTQEAFDAAMLRIEKNTLESLQPPNVDNIMNNLRNLSGLCAQGGRLDLAMSQAEMEAYRDRLVATWRKLRDQDEPKLDAMRDMFVAYFKERGGAPTIEELVAASSIFCMSRGMGSERAEFRKLIAAPYGMQRQLNDLHTKNDGDGLAEVRERPRYKAAHKMFMAMMVEVEADLERQKQAAHATMTTMIERAAPPTDQEMATAREVLAGEGVHTYYLDAFVAYVPEHFASAMTR